MRINGVKLGEYPYDILPGPWPHKHVKQEYRLANGRTFVKARIVALPGEWEAFMLHIAERVLIRGDGGRAYLTKHGFDFRGPELERR